MKSLRASKVSITKYPKGKMLIVSSRRIPRVVSSLAHQLTRISVLKKSYLDIFRLISLPTESESAPKNSDLPPIDLLMVLHHKDIWIARTALEMAVKNSYNTISHITIIATSIACNLLTEEPIQLTGVNSNIQIEVLNENDFVPTEIVRRCSEFGSASGWLIQQAIKILYVIRTNSRGTLVIDSDTIILNKICWLTEENRSPIFANWHKSNPKILDFLKIVNPVVDSQFNLVSHFMLLKSEILGALLNNLSIRRIDYYELSDPSDLRNTKATRLETVLEDTLAYFGTEMSEYDLYGKYAINYDRANCELLRWSNIEVRTNDLNAIDLQELIERNSKSYTSLSIHIHHN